MPLLLIALGIILIITAVEGDAAELGALIINDVRGTDNQTGYAVWMFVIIGLGLLGYVKNLQNLSRAFMILVVVVLLLHNRGFFAELQKQIMPQKAGG